MWTWSFASSVMVYSAWAIARSVVRLLAAAPVKERAAVQKQLDELAERRKTMLPLLLKLRDMAGDGRMLKDGKRAPFQVKVGDRVLFSSYAGEEFKVGDRELLLMREEDVLAVIV